MTPPDGATSPFSPYFTATIDDGARVVLTGTAHRLAAVGARLVVH